jgi:hypothetical protein
MTPTRQRLLGVGAALSAIAVAAPLSNASATMATPAVAPVPMVAPGWGGFTALPFTGPATVVGPVIITTAPTIFVNTNNQVSVDGNWSGGQATV